jgi:hypothetical protein
MGIFETRDTREPLDVFFEEGQQRADERRLEFLKSLVEDLSDIDGYMQREYGEQMAKFEKAGRIGRWIIGKRYPRVKEHYEYVAAQKSVADARRRSDAMADEIIIK